jgi:hypothetical protein
MFSYFFSEILNYSEKKTQKLLEKNFWYHQKFNYRKDSNQLNH